MLYHNKVLRNIEIFDFVIFRDGSYCKHNKVLGYPTEICDFVLGDGSYYSLFS